MSRSRARTGFFLAVALGIFTRSVHLGVRFWDKSAGDVLYAVMVGCALAWAWPRIAPRTLGLLTFSVCFAIELFQETGIPARAPRLVQMALGTTFAWHDVACYAVGALLAMVLHRRLR